MLQGLSMIKISGTDLLRKTNEAKKKIVVHQGGTRSSKTYSIIQHIILECLTKQNKYYSVIRATLPALKRSVMKDFFDELKKIDLYSERNHNKSDNTYFLNGNEIQFFSCDDQQKVRGTKRDVLWINEANEIELEDFRQLLMRTTEKIFLDFNPSDPEDHWIYTEVIDARDDVDLIISNYLDNIFLSDSQIKEIERFKKTDYIFWKVFGLGERADVQKGNVFNKKHYQEYEILPQDIKSVIYCDPNLSIKNKGDNTSIVCLGYSAKTNAYYVVDAILHSFDDSNFLLNTIFKYRFPHTLSIGFDGNVSQESTWTNLVKNWCQINDQIFPRLEYKRYRVDDLSKNIMLAWAENKIYFPINFSQTTNGKMFLSQLYSFTNKKVGNPDDAPDSLICAFEFLHEKRIVKKESAELYYQPKIILETF